MKISIIPISLLFVGITSYADVQNYAPREYSIIPPSPEVSSLINFYDVPVDYFHGLPDINLPLYELTQGEIKVPITIRYHGGGVKVDDMEGNLGLSWALMAGGAISRTVYGAPDDANEMNLKGLFNATENDKKLREFVLNKGADYIPNDLVWYVDHYRDQGLYGIDYYYGKSDTANDIFKVSALGFSGTFIYDDNKQMVMTSDTPYSLEPSSMAARKRYPAEFILTDSHGVKYYFSTEEESLYKYKYGKPVLDLLEDSLRYTSAWHLTKIKNLNNDSIMFHYRQKTKTETSGGCLFSWFQIDNSRLGGYTPPYSASSGKAVYYPKVLSSIENNSTIVTFRYSDKSLNGMTELITDIEIAPKSTNGSIVKKYHFVYTEFDNKYYYPGYVSDRKRCMLSEIRLNDETLYKFDYITDEEGYISFSGNSQDFCGYNNDRDNRSLVPHHGVLAGMGADRSVNPNMAAMGSLKSIIYPTGGKTELEWESNEYGYVKSIPVRKSINTPTITTFESDTLVGLEPLDVQKLKINNFKVSNGEVVYLDLTEYFRFNPQILALSDYENEHDSQYKPSYPGVYFFLNGSQSGEPNAVYYIDKPTVEERNNNTQFEVVLPAGTYTVELRDRISVEGREDEIKAQFRYDYGTCGRIFLRRCKTTGGTTETIAKDYWGGLRIKRITSDPCDGGTPIIKDYFYNSTTSPHECSGTVNALPFFYNLYYLVTPHPSLPGQDETTVHCVSSNGLYNTPIGSQSTVEYPEVTVRYSGKDCDEPSALHNYGEKYFYTSLKDKGADDYNDSDFQTFQPRYSQMWTSRAHLRGNLTKKQTGVVSPLDVTTYEYNIYESDNRSVFTTDLFTVADFSCINDKRLYQCAYDFGIGKYTLILYNKTVKSEKYAEAEGFETEVEYEYFYDEYTDNLDRSLVKARRTTDSDGSQRTTYYTYLMAGANLALDYPETEVTVVDGKIVDASRMEYDENRRLKAVYGMSARTASASAYGLGGKKASDALKALINRPEYTYRYDSRGNLAEISYNGVVLASYLWGYMGSHPIVEAKYLTHAELVAAANRADGRTVESLLASSFTTGEQLNNFFTKLRAQLPDTELTTITYHWLIGVSEATDPRGVKTTFTYDKLGRLSGIKDYNDYFIKKYIYHFKNI